jgi:hypothetical protein
LSASQADVSGRWLDAVLAARPDLAAKLKTLLEGAKQQEAAEFVADLRSNDPEGFGVLAEIVPAAYFMNAAVLFRRQGVIDEIEDDASVSIEQKQVLAHEPIRENDRERRQQLE